MTKSTFEWTSPLDWLLQHIAKANRAGIFAIAIRLACLLDADTIQDMFSYEMEEDGYFEPIDE